MKIKNLNLAEVQPMPHPPLVALVDSLIDTGHSFDAIHFSRKDEDRSLRQRRHNISTESKNMIHVTKEEMYKCPGCR